MREEPPLLRLELLELETAGALGALGPPERPLELLELPTLERPLSLRLELELLPERLLLESLRPLLLPLRPELELELLELDPLERPLSERLTVPLSERPLLESLRLVLELLPERPLLESLRPVLELLRPLSPLPVRPELELVALELGRTLPLSERPLSPLPVRPLLSLRPLSPLPVRPVLVSLRPLMLLLLLLLGVMFDSVPLMLWLLTLLLGRTLAEGASL